MTTQNQAPGISDATQSCDHSSSEGCSSDHSNSDQLSALIARHCGMSGALLPVLHAIQDNIGFIPEMAVPLIADALNLSRAEVHGVITYYHHFRQTPPGRTVIQVCRAEACQARGADKLAQHVQTQLGCDFHATTADGSFTLESVYCLGLCACGPAITMNDQLYARVSPEKFNQLLKQGNV